MESCCGVGLLSNISMKSSNKLGHYNELTPENIKSLAESLDHALDKFKEQYEKNKNGAGLTPNYFTADMPGLVYAFLTTAQRNRFGVAFDMAGWSTVKLDKAQEKRDQMENVIHGPYYITTYYKVHYGKTK